MGRNISLDDYQHAQNVWSTFECESFQDYMEINVELGYLVCYFNVILIYLFRCTITG